MSTRKPRAKKTITSVAEMVLDLEQRMEGDADGEVLLPAEEWRELVRCAQGSSADLADVYARSAQLLQQANDDLRERLEAADERRKALAREVGWGSLNSFDELLQVVRGYMMALDVEVARSFIESPKTATESEQPLSADKLAELAADSGRRLNGAGWKRNAKNARESNSLTACHHCGTHDDDEENKLTHYHNDSDVPDGTFCVGCIERLKRDPYEWPRHFVPSADATPKVVEQAPARRGRKAKPAQTEVPF
jgi:hypothetical protein